MDNSKYIEGIKSTGFGLEFTISNNLIEEGWTVINNKYYIDDVQGSAREIDIVAYKASMNYGTQIYTVLIISCKKSSQNTWALLSKAKNNNDPNIDWKPVTLWSNQKILRHIIENTNWKDEYVNSSQELKNKLFSPQKHIFAFQELNTNTGKNQNDKAIFNSIVSSMKSQNYEIASLEKRKTQESIYNFNLISIVDAPLIRINYGNEEPNVEPIDSDIYVGSYIINKKETISRIHFITSDYFNSHLSIYNELHSHNINQTKVLYESFFTDCIKDKQKIKLFINKFSKLIRWQIYKTIKEVKNDPSFNDVIEINWDNEKNSAGIKIKDVWREEEIDILNQNNELKVDVESALKRVYQYEGEFHFKGDLPF